VLNTIFLLFTLCATGGQQTNKVLYENIYNSIIEEISTNNYSVNQYLGFSKPYGKYDLRTRTKDYCFLGTETNDTIWTTDIINLTWGRIAKHVFKMPVDSAIAIPNEFIAEGYYNEDRYRKEFFIPNQETIVKLAILVLQSKNNIYVQQSNYENLGYSRVGDVFSENNIYWKYKIPDGSPFLISDKKEILKDYEYSNADKDILKILLDLKCYCVAKEGRNILFLTGGIIDNCIGFIYSSEKPTNQNLGLLYHIYLIEDLGNNFYYFISN